MSGTGDGEEQGRARGRGRGSTRTEGRGAAVPAHRATEPVAAWGRTGESRQAVVPPADGPWGRAISSQPKEQQQHSQQEVISARAAASSGAVPRSKAPALQAHGRATLHRTQPSREQEAARGEGGNGRGATRGRRVINEIIRTRPLEMQSKKGTSGNEVTLQSNYFRALRRPNWTLCHYRVDFSPDIENIRVRKGIIYNNREQIGGHIFDGQQLFTTKELPTPLEIATKNRDDEIIKVTIKKVGEIESSDAQYSQILNLILRKSMAGLKLQLVGRNLFDPANKINLREYKMEIWPGYVTSFRQHETDFLLCAEISHKVMRTETIWEIMKKYVLDSRNWQEDFKKEVIGMTVLTDYNNKTYRIDDVDFQSTPSLTFSTRDGEISFVDYYKKKYNKIIRDHNQPLLASKSNERSLRAGQSEIILLIPELCRATGLTEQMKNNFRLMRAMSDETRLPPSLRIQRLISFNKRLCRTPESIDVLNSWQLTLDQNLVEFSGRILKMENIVFGGQRKVPAGADADWTRHFRDASMLCNVALKNWHLIVPQRCKHEAEQFVNLVIKAATGMRMQITAPRVEQLPDDRSLTFIKSIENCLNRDTQLLFFVVPNVNAERYSAIKRKTCVDRAIPSQVVVHKTITPKAGKGPSSLMSIATKVAIQMNCKLGGAPWGVELPLTGLMTIGFDVSHSTRDKSQSYGALVATMDLKSCTKFFSAISPHVKGTELSNEINVMVVRALRQYREMHSALPQRILFYRDGVGEGQLHQVLDHEVKNLQTQLAEIYRDAGIESGCKFAFIVVSKRINTRLFLNKENPPPGTIVDDVVTLPERYDFYLISQSVRQGTVSPTSYNVIESKTFGLPPDKIQILTYKFCHLYFNYSGATRVPAVCQYAHKLAFLVGNFIHTNPSNLLEKNLYFL